MGIWRREMSWEERPWREASVLKESEEGFVVVFGELVREKTINGSIRQMSVFLSKIVILIEDHSGKKF